MFPAKQISISINCSPAMVYNFASNPENLPQWAAGLSGAAIVKSGDFWICNSPMGQVKVKFAANNLFGVMDHDVIFSSGEVNHNPFRVAANGKASEVIFTLYRLPGMSDEDFMSDANLILNDLKKLKSILEK